MNYKKKYAPRPRFVAEVTKPRLVALYRNGELIDPKIYNAAIESRPDGFTLTFDLDAINKVEDVEYRWGSFNDVEFEWVEE